MAVTRTQFIARAPGKNFTGTDATLVQTMLDASDAELAGSGTSKDERIHWLAGYKLASYIGDNPAREAFLKEYERLTHAEFGGPRIF